MWYIQILFKHKLKVYLIKIFSIIYLRFQYSFIKTGFFKKKRIKVFNKYSLHTKYVLY